MTWEYLLTELAEPLQKSAIEILNDYGRQGWEAYAVTRVPNNDPHGHFGGSARPSGWTTVHMKRRSVPSPSGGEK